MLVYCKGLTHAPALLEAPDTTYLSKRAAHQRGRGTDANERSAADQYYRTSNTTAAVQGDTQTSYVAWPLTSWHPGLEIYRMLHTHGRAVEVRPMFSAAPFLHEGSSELTALHE